METIQIALPERMREFVEAEVAEGGYGSPTEYFLGLVRERQKQKAQEKLEALLLEGLDSGPSVEVTPEWWQELRREVAERTRQQGASR